jgi:hypothetical protein
MKLKEPNQSMLDEPSEDFPYGVIGGYLPSSVVDPENTLMQTVYEACNRDLIEERVKAGTVLQSESALYSVIKALPSSSNLFEVVGETAQPKKYLARVYDCDEVHKF